MELRFDKQKILSQNAKLNISNGVTPVIYIFINGEIFYNYRWHGDIKGPFYPSASLYFLPHPAHFERRIEHIFCFNSHLEPNLRLQNSFL